jgi:predicted RNase H-like HicB family nuclease
LSFSEKKELHMTKEKEVLHLPVVIEQDEDEIYIVSCPVYKGCHSYGKTIEEALGNLKEVIEMCVEE